MIGKDRIVFSALGAVAPKQDISMIGTLPASTPVLYPVRSALHFGITALVALQDEEPARIPGGV